MKSRIEKGVMFNSKYFFIYSPKYFQKDLLHNHLEKKKLGDIA